MKSLYLLLAGLVVGLVVGVAPSLSQDMGGETDDGSEACGGMQDKWAELQQPGEHQEWLAEDEGEWDISAKMWMEGMDEPIEMAGSSTITMWEDRYAYEVYQLGEGDMQYKGFGYMAYDNSNEQYQAMYAGNSGTALHVLSGQRDGNKVELSGTHTEKGMGGMEVTTRVVTERISKDKSTVTIYDTYGDAPEKKIIEMTYTRKK